MANTFTNYFQRFRALTLLTALLGVILTIGRLDDGQITIQRVLVAVAYGAVFLGAGYLIGAQRKWLLVYLGFAFISMVANMISTAFPSEQTSSFIDYLTSLIMQGMLLYMVFKFTLFDQSDDHVDRVIAGISGYLLLSLIWYNFYSLHEVLDPGGFAAGNGTDVALGDGSLMYYSLVTLSTLGYGDITPTTSSSRMLSALQAVTGTLFLAIYVSTLVSAFRRK